MQPEITIDARWLRTGLGTYTYNLITRLRPYLAGFSLRGIVQQSSANRVASYCDSIAVVDTPIYTIREQLQIPWSARGADLLHIPHYNVPLLYGRRMVVTIHDLIHLVDEEESRKAAVKTYASLMLKAATRKAERIITVSNFSRDQIAEHLGVKEEKIVVIPNGVALHLRSADGTRNGAYERGRPYFLYVGNLKPHKNLKRLMQAVALVRSRTGWDWDFLIAGPNDQAAIEPYQEQARRLHISDSVMFLTEVSDQALPDLYRGAKFLVLPSTLEGFGLPVLEAMACGTPVACSQAASLPEVGGEAVRYFDPVEIEDIAAVLEALASSKDLRADLAKKGLARAAQFSWDESARRHAALYRQVLNN